MPYTSDQLRFPPDLSAQIAAEIAAIAWSETDLLNDIPEDMPEVEYLASMYADTAAEIWEERNEVPVGYVIHRVIDTARRTLIPRIAGEFDRRERLVAAEYARRRRGGLIDASGFGDIPTYYGMLEDDPALGVVSSGRDSDGSGWVHPEVSHMATIARSDIIRLWHFECPECGFTDAELGSPADEHSAHCLVCLEEGDTVRLKRWPLEELSALPASRAA